MRPRCPGRRALRPPPLPPGAGRALLGQGRDGAVAPGRGRLPASGGGRAGPLGAGARGVGAVGRPRPAQLPIVWRRRCPQAGGQRPSGAAGSGRAGEAERRQSRGIPWKRTVRDPDPARSGVKPLRGRAALPFLLPPPRAGSLHGGLLASGRRKIRLTHQ